MAKINVAFSIVVSQEVEANVDMFGFGMKYRVLCHTNCTSAFTKQGNSLKAQAKISQSGFHPKELGAAASSSNIFSFYSGLGYARMLARGSRHQRRTWKLICTRSKLTIQMTTCKISI
jgi:hypothetical protein